MAVLLVLLFAALLAVVVADSSFDDHVLSHVRGATTSDSAFRHHKTDVGLAIGGATVFLGSVFVAGLIAKAFENTAI